MLELNEENLREYYSNQYHTLDELAEIFGVSCSTITRYVNIYKLVKCKKLDPITKDFLYNEYIVKNKSLKQIIEETGATRKAITYRLDKYKIYKSQEAITELKKAAYLEHYGVDNPMKNKEVRDKLAKTNTELYGAATPFESKEIQDKIHKILAEKNPPKEKEIKVPKRKSLSHITKEQLEDLYINKNYSREKTAKLLDINENQIKYLLDKYRIIKSVDKIHENLIHSLNEQYGVDNVFQLKEIKEKRNKIMMERYGDTIPLRIKEINKQMHETMCEKYGVPHALQNKELREKAVQTTFDHYGVDNIFQLRTELMDRSNKKLNEIFRSQEVFTNFLKENNIHSVKDICEYAKCSIYPVYQRLNYYNYEYDFENVASSYEYELLEFIKSIGIQNIDDHNRDILNGQEIDVYLPDYRLGLEFNGDYWHSDLFKLANYHQNKSLLAESKNAYILHIFEHDWVDNEDITKALIKNLVGKANPVADFDIIAEDDLIKIIADDNQLLNLSIVDSVATPIKIDFNYSVKDIFANKKFKKCISDNRLDLCIDFTKCLDYFLDEDYKYIETTDPNIILEGSRFSIYGCGYRIYRVGAGILNE